MIQDTMTIREMCEAFEVTARALRFYEDKELLAPIREGQKRLFTRKDRARLKLILQGKRFGFSLEDMRQILDLYDGEGDNYAQIDACQKLAARRLEEMQKEYEMLGSAIADLRNEMREGEAQLAALRGEYRACA